MFLLINRLKKHYPVFREPVEPSPSLAAVLVLLFEKEEKIVNKLNKRTKAVFISHITSSTGLIFPVEEVCRIAKENNLWLIEDDKRMCEKKSDFGDKFIKLSRDVHILNDDRAKIKLEINKHTKSKIKEIKEYTNY